MRVLIGYSACPLTRAAFERRGHIVWTCDLLPSRDGNTETHYQGDVWDIAEDPMWDIGIFHPMCTYLTASAAWAFNDPDFDRYPGVGYHQRVKPGTLTGEPRREARREAIENFKRIEALPYPTAIENPAPSLLSSLHRSPDQTIQPYQFGDDASKRTGLWLDQLPPLRIDPAKRVAGRMVNGKERWSNQTDSGQNKLTPGENRWLERSKTYPGIAEAFAENWG